MTNITFLIAIIFFIKVIYCSDDLLSKVIRILIKQSIGKRTQKDIVFHQNGYKIKDFRMQLISYDKDYINYLEIKPFKYNRTTTAHNATLNMKVNMGNKLEGLVQAYKFLSNEYRHFPVRYQVNLKKSFDANLIGMQKIKECGNMTDFIFYKDTTYHGCNFLIDETKYPPFVPNGRYKAECQLLYLNEEIAMLHVFAEIYTPIYPKD